MKNWKETVTEMHRLKKHYTRHDTPENDNVHRTLVKRALLLIKNAGCDAGDIIAPYLDTILQYCVQPDLEGDHEKGKGRHYYCAVNTSGIKQLPVGGYYRNGTGKFAQSARTMFEEDYTMALTMWYAGHHEKAAEYLGRAIHMVSDMCCLPHAAKMTYYSSKAAVHKTYEELARALYPSHVAEQSITKKDLRFFGKSGGFGRELNKLASAAAAERIFLRISPVKEISARLYATEKAVAALIYRFSIDIALPPQKAHFLRSGMKIRFRAGGEKYTVSVAEDGLRFISPEGTLFSAGKYDLFRAAHRSGGNYTISPVTKDGKDRVLRRRSGEIVIDKFNPLLHSEMFRFYR